MNDFLLVDGYNVIHAWDELKKIMEDDLEHARLKLIDWLAEYSALKGLRTIVVFDAHLVKSGSGATMQLNGVQVVYTAEGETADSYIERLTAKLTGVGKVAVATSDWDQQRIVFGKGAVRIPVRELREEVRKSITETRLVYDRKIMFDRTIRDNLDSEVKAVLEKIRRQK